jgi:hypothetical protein
MKRSLLLLALISLGCSSPEVAPAGAPQEAPVHDRVPIDVPSAFLCRFPITG